MVDKLGPYELNSIITGDARELSKAIPDESVDLIFTDPPYPKEYIPLYGWLAKTATRILKPGGSLFALFGHYYALEVLDQVRAHLDYHWLACMYQPTITNSYRCFPKHVDVYWKPIMWFTKGEYRGPFLADGINTTIPDKRFHQWGQQERWAFSFLERMPKEWAVVDPMCGGGTVPAVCKMLNRRYLAFEIDPETADLARERVANTQPPLPLVMPEQLAFETTEESL